jgi:hypothetical protein
LFDEWDIAKGKMVVGELVKALRVVAKKRKKERRNKLEN